MAWLKMNDIFKDLKQLLNRIYRHDFIMIVDKEYKTWLSKQFAENSINYWQEITKNFLYPFMSQEVELFPAKTPFYPRILNVSGGYDYHDCSVALF